MLINANDAKAITSRAIYLKRIAFEEKVKKDKDKKTENFLKEISQKIINAANDGYNSIRITIVYDDLFLLESISVYNYKLHLIFVESNYYSYIIKW